MNARALTWVSSALFVAALALAVALGLAFAANRDDDCESGLSPAEVVFEDVDGKRWEAVVCAMPAP